jgi:hypothetical protein
VPTVERPGQRDGLLRRSGAGGFLRVWHVAIDPVAIRPPVFPQDFLNPIATRLFGRRPPFVLIQIRRPWLHASSITVCAGLLTIAQVDWPEADVSSVSGSEIAVAGLLCLVVVLLISALVARN